MQSSGSCQLSHVDALRQSLSVGLGKTLDIGRVDVQALNAHRLKQVAGFVAGDQPCTCSHA